MRRSTCVTRKQSRHIATRCVTYEFRCCASIGTGRPTNVSIDARSVNTRRRQSIANSRCPLKMMWTRTLGDRRLEGTPMMRAYGVPPMHPFVLAILSNANHPTGLAQVGRSHSSGLPEGQIALRAIRQLRRRSRRRLPSQYLYVSATIDSLRGRYVERRDILYSCSAQAKAGEAVQGPVEERARQRCLDIVFHPRDPSAYPASRSSPSPSCGHL